MIREDLLHPKVPGPKYRRIRAELEESKRSGKTRVVTTGGLHSNHVHGVAVLAQEAGMLSRAYIRGLANTESSGMMLECAEMGMELIPLTRHEFDASKLGSLHPDLPLQNEDYFIPLGCQGEIGEGAMFIWGKTLWEHPLPQYVALTAGTGTTLRGLQLALPPAQKFIVAAPFKDPSFILEPFTQMERKQIHLIGSVDGQRFGQQSPVARLTAEDFETKTGLWVDNLYMPTLLNGLQKMCLEGFFAPRQEVWVLHCGGALYNRL